MVVSGDVSDELGALEQALGCLAAKFAAVFYCVGNHELWVRKKDRRGAALLHRNVCGVNETGMKLGDGSRHANMSGAQLGSSPLLPMGQQPWLAPLGMISRNQI